MADKLISGLPEATSIAGNDLLVTEQTSIAKKITAENLLHSLDELWTEHGGIESFELYSTSGLSKTYRMTYADESYTDITITDGTGITNIVTTTSGLTHTITISLNDGTTKVFTVNDGVGISSISAPSSVGLVDTYIINLSDGSATSFTVTNGASVSSITLNGTTITFAKDDGNTIDLPVPTLRIRYSATQPDDDNDIITTPSNYMGVAWALDSAVLHYTDYAWFKIKGETGDNAEVSSYTRQYKYTDDGTQYPTSGYYSTIAAAQSAVGGAIQGKYLWIATTITWNNGTPSVIYTSSYQGLDGTGLSGVVKSLYMSDTSTSLAPDANGQVTVTSADVGAIKAPATASDGQVLTWDATDQVWYAGSVSTGTVNSVNSQLPDAGGNVALKGTDIPIDSTPTANVAVMTDANGKLKASSVTATELGVLSGISANTTELNYVHGVTSAIQTQLNGKQSTLTFDALPTADSTNPVTSGGIKTYEPYRIYNSVTELGLTSGSATIAGAYAALPNGSILLARSDDFLSSELPSAYGIVEMVRIYSYRSFINFYATYASSNDAKMYIDSSTYVPLGTWIPVARDWETVWTNDSPTSSFSAQTIPLSLSRYNQIMVHFRFSTSVPYQFHYTTNINNVTGYATGFSGWATNSAMYFMQRTVYVDDDEVTFGDLQRKQFSSTTLATTDNTFMIPVQILARR